MALKKSEREKLKQKYGGRCAYCGCELGDKWHADHIEPIVRNDWCHRVGMDKSYNRAPDYPERDCIENMNPACAPCNIDKHSFSLEHWRDQMQKSNDVLMRDNATFRRAVRYGLVKLISEPIVFYFEKVSDAHT